MEPFAQDKSPFSPTASPDTAACWAGRQDALERLLRIQRSFRRPDSSLHVVWANLGAGKSHALYHLKHLIDSSQERDRYVAVVVEIPEQIRKFIDLYGRIVSHLPLSRLATATAKASVSSLNPDLRQCGNVLLNGGPREQALASDWISAKNPHLSELRRFTGISSRIDDDVAATDVMCGIVNSFQSENTRLVLLLDEFQRMNVLKTAARDAVLSCLRSVFSQCSSYITVVVAIGSRVEKTALDILPPELKTLLSRQPTISLPEMDKAEAMEFVLGRFAYFRPAQYCGSPSFPFASESIAAVIGYLADEVQVPLIPREILQALAYVYDEAFDGHQEINQATCLNLLKEMRFENSKSCSAKS